MGTQYTISYSRKRNRRSCKEWYIYQRTINNKLVVSPVSNLSFWDRVIPLKSAVPLVVVVRPKHCRPSAESGFTGAYFNSVGTLRLRITRASPVFTGAMVAVSQAGQDYCLPNKVLERQSGIKGFTEC